MTQLPRVCIIGAGSSGIATCKVFQERGIPYDCFEKSDRIGGNWVFRNKNGMSSAYRSLHINTSKYMMAYSDFPMPDDYPDFPHHTQIADYFESYVDHFGFRDTITFNTGVENARRREDGIWEISLDNGDAREYDALCVVNGHHWNPRWPEPAFPGEFHGEQVHSHHYIDPTDPVDCVDKNVVVVGMGNSGLDLACELGRKGVAKNLFLSVRRGYWIMPKYFGSDVLDAAVPHPSQDTPAWMRFVTHAFGGAIARHLLQKRIEQVVGRPEDYGLPKPDHPLLATHPAVSNEIAIRLGSGDVLPRANIQELQGDKVLFADGTVEDVDVIIYATGYKITFPFFDEDFISAPDNDIPLFKRIIDPRYPNLFFIALVQPLCAMMPIAEEQSKFVASHIAGDYALPNGREMDRDMRERYEAMRGAYVKTPRHTIQVNCGEYTYDLRQELKRGAKRAAATGNALPIPARAGGQAEAASTG